jgi:DNA-binding Lrp family transcriptional regulator
MMAYVLINTEIGCIPEVLKAVKKIKNVSEAHSVYGVYDIVIKIHAESMAKLKDVVTWNIRRLNNVRSTLTMIVMEETNE